MINRGEALNIHYTNNITFILTTNILVFGIKRLYIYNNSKNIHLGA